MKMFSNRFGLAGQVLLCVLFLTQDVLAKVPTVPTTRGCKPKSCAVPKVPNVDTSFVDALRAKYCPPFFPVPGTADSCLSKSVILKQENFNPATGVVITEPGTYCLFSDVTWNPAQDFLPAITIMSSNVDLYLNGHTIAGNAWLAATPSTFQNTVGIAVTSTDSAGNAINNVNILNGDIRGMSLYGISIGDGTKDITIDGIDASRNGMIGTQIGAFIRAGINVGSALNINILNSSFNENISENNGAGINVRGTIELLIDNIEALQNYGQAFANGINISITGTNNLLISNSQFDRNGTKPSSNFPDTLTQANGFRSPGGIIINNVFIENCTFNNNGTLGSAANTQSRGVLIAQVNNLIIENTEANGNFAPNGSGSVAEGFFIGIAGTRIEMYNCTANDQDGSDSSIGIYVQAPNSIIENCSANNNTSSNPIAALANGNFGFLLRGSIMRIKNCTATNNSRSITNANSAGFALSPVAAATSPITNFVVEDCLAQNNQGNSPGSAGFRILGISQSKFINCTSIGNSRGIFLGSVFAIPSSNNNLFQDNYVANNVVAGIVDSLGAVPTNTNTYIRNIAKLNSTNPAVNNYVGLPAGMPIVKWTSSAVLPLPTASGPEFDNISVEY